MNCHESGSKIKPPCSNRSEKERRKEKGWNEHGILRDGGKKKEKRKEKDEEKWGESKWGRGKEDAETGEAMDIGGMWHEEVQAGWKSWGIKMREWKRGGKTDVWFTDSSFCSGAELHKARKIEKKEEKPKLYVGILRKTIIRNRKKNQRDQKKERKENAKCVWCGHDFCRDRSKLESLTPSDTTKIL